jgi:hypothetical protein
VFLLYSYSLPYKSAKEGTIKGNFCTNVPIHCPLCKDTLSGKPKTVWKYNVFLHLHTKHLQADGYLPPIPPEFWVDAFIARTEEAHMGVPSSQTDNFSNSNTIPDSDTIEEML